MQLINKAALFLSMSLFLFACGGKQGEKKTSPEANLQQNTAAESSAPAVQEQSAVAQPFFNGAGTSPEWNMEILANVDGTFLIRLSKENEQSKTFKATKEPLYTEGKVNAASGEVKLSGSSDDGAKISISLVTGNCKDARGKEHSHSCKVLLDKETLKGCGDYME